jgi:hypothetical protein
LSQASAPIDRYLGFLRYVTNPDAKDPARAHVLGTWALPIAAVGLIVAMYALSDSVLLNVLGTIAVLILLAVAVLASFVAVERKRRDANYRITAAEFWRSPKSTRQPMRGIFDAAETFTGTSAFATGVIDGRGFHESIYAAARSAVDANAFRAEIELSRSDSSLTAELKSAIADIEEKLLCIEADLRVAATESVRLSGRLPAPPPPVYPKTTARSGLPRPSSKTSEEQQRLAREKRIADINARKFATLEMNTLAADAAKNVNDAVSGLAAGYDEVTRISRRVVEGPDLEVLRSESRGAPVADDTAPGAAPVADDTAPGAARQQDTTAARGSIRAAAQRSRSAYQQAKTAGRSVNQSIEDSHRLIDKSRKKVAEAREAVNRTLRGE